MEADPYAPPTTFSGDEDRAPSFTELIHAWERLRLIYNALMLLPGIGVLILWSQRAGMPIQLVLILGALVGLGANACFFLGPLSELYLRGLFFNNAKIGRGRWLIFGAGLLVSAGVLIMASVIPLLY